MRRTDLELVISDYITNLYNANYTGTLEVYEEDGLYTMKLGMPSYMSLTTISAETSTDADFISFIQEELRSRNYMRVDNYRVVREEIINKY